MEENQEQQPEEEKKSISEILNELLTCEKDFETISGSKKDPSGYSVREKNILNDAIKWFNYINHHKSQHSKIKKKITKDEIFKRLEEVLTRDENIRNLISEEFDRETSPYSLKKDLGLYKRVTDEGKVRIEYYQYNALCEDFCSILSTVGCINDKPGLIEKQIELRRNFEEFERRHLFQDTYFRYIFQNGPLNNLEKIAHLASIDKITGKPYLKELRDGKYVGNAFSLDIFRHVVDISSTYDEEKKLRSKILLSDNNETSSRKKVFKSKRDIGPTRGKITEILIKKNSKRSNKTKKSATIREILFESNDEDYYISKEHFLDLIMGRNFPKTSYQSYQSILDHVLMFNPQDTSELSKVKSLLHQVHTNFKDNQFEILTRSKEVLSCDEVVREIYHVYEKYFVRMFSDSQIERLSQIKDFMHELFIDHAYSKDCIPKIRKKIRTLFEEDKLSPRETFDLVEKTKQIYPSIRTSELLDEWRPYLLKGDSYRKNTIEKELEGISKFKESAHKKRNFTSRYNIFDIINKSINFLDSRGYDKYLKRLQVRDYVLTNFKDNLKGHYLTKIFEEVYLNGNYDDFDPEKTLKAITNVKEKETHEVYDFRDQDSLEEFLSTLKGQVKLYEMVDDHRNYEELEKEFMTMTMRKKTRFDGTIINFEELETIDTKDLWAVPFFRKIVLKENVTQGHWENLTYLVNNGFLLKYLKSIQKFGELRLPQLESCLSSFIETSRITYNRLTYFEEKKSLDESKDKKFNAWVNSLTQIETFDEMMSTVRFIPSSIHQIEDRQSIDSFNYRKVLAKTSAMVSGQPLNFQEINSFIQGCHFPNLSYGVIKMPQSIACHNSKQDNERLLETLTHLQSAFYRYNYLGKLLEYQDNKGRGKEKVTSREIYEMFQSFENPDFAYTIFNSLLYRKAKEDIAQEFEGLTGIVTKSLQKVKESLEMNLFEIVAWTKNSDKVLDQIQKYNIFSYCPLTDPNFEEINKEAEKKSFEGSIYKNELYAYLKRGATAIDISKRFRMSIHKANGYLGAYKKSEQSYEYHNLETVNFFNNEIIPILESSKNETVPGLFEVTKQIYSLIHSKYGIKSKTEFVEFVGKVSNMEQTSLEKRSYKKTTGLKFSDCPQYFYDDPVTSRKARIIVMPAGSIQNSKVDQIREKHSKEISRARQLFQLLKPQRVTYERRAYEGELDVDLYIEAMLDLKNGNVPDTNVFTNRRINQRDVSLLLTVDQSKFLMKPFRTKEGKLDRPLAHVQPALVYALDSMAELDDKFAILGYSSRTAEEIMIKIIKDFDESSSDEVKNRIGMLAPIAYSRTGSVYKYFAETFSTMPGRRKIHIDIVTKLANDTDYNGEAALKDTAEAAQRERSFGIELYGICLDQDISSEQLNQVYGQGRFLKLDDYSDLPSSILNLYRVIALS